MTVCIAARSQGMILMASDRMVTVGDVEFEPPVPKTHFLSPSVAVMYSGDSALHAEIMHDVIAETRARIAATSPDQLMIKEATDIYLKHWHAAKLRRAEAAILFPLGLTRDVFFTGGIEARLLKRLTEQLMHFPMPLLEVIIAGVDMRYGEPAPSIYTISNGEFPAQAEPACADLVSFAAIGIGAKHAEIQFMLNGHNHNTPNGAALLLLFAGKKAAEVAPGVGKVTDFYMIGAIMGRSSEIPPEVMKKVESEFEKIKIGFDTLRLAGWKEVERHLDELNAALKTKAETPSDTPETPEKPEESTKSTPPT